VLSALPKSAHPGAKKALAEIWNAEDRRHALDAVTAFKALYGVKFPKAVAKVTDDVEELLAFYDYPAQHWIHLRTTNPIESTFATVRHRTKVTKGPGSSAAGLAMAFKLIESAQDRWRAVNAPHLVALVRAGARFEAGQLVERTVARSHSSRNCSPNVGSACCFFSKVAASLRTSCESSAVPSAASRTAVASGSSANLALMSLYNPATARPAAAAAMDTRTGSGTAIPSTVRCKRLGFPTSIRPDFLA
jgi:hypothetical protein